jgi:hypothetical protein
MHYAVTIPMTRTLTVGYVFVVVAVGDAIWHARRGCTLQDISALFVFLSAVLAFVTWGLMRGQHLGLERHSAALAPLFCTLAAMGAVRSVELGMPRARRPQRHLVAIVAVAIVGELARTVPAIGRTARRQATSFLEERAAAAMLRQMAPTTTVFCDVPAVEVLSGLEPRRFIRWNVSELAPWHVRQRSVGADVAIVGTPAALSHLASLGSTTYQSARIAVLLRRGAAQGGS